MKDQKRAERIATKEAKSITPKYKKKNRIKGDSKKPKYKIKF